MNDNLKVNILGCGSAAPTLRHSTSCQIVDYRSALYMIDCGEGTQTRMLRSKLSPHKLTHIFLSHLHGDHCFGLLPLLSTMALKQKGGEVVIHTSPEGEKIFAPMIDFFIGSADYKITFNAVDPAKRHLLVETGGLTVESFPLYHRVPAMGFLFREKPKLRHLRGDMLEFYNIPIYARNAIKNGSNFIMPDGTVIPNERLTTDATPSVSYAYCSDTVFNPKIAADVEGVDLLYHEATYEAEYAQKARSRGHSTAEEAARIAKMANVGRLILGHFSSAADEERILHQAREIFPATDLANEGLQFTPSPH